MTSLGDITSLGYEVDIEPASGVVCVCGFGVATMIDPGDAAALAALADPDAHVERVNQFNDLHGIPVTAKAKKHIWLSPNTS